MQTIITLKNQKQLTESPISVNYAKLIIKNGFDVQLVDCTVLNDSKSYLDNLLDTMIYITVLNLQKIGYLGCKHKTAS